MSRDSLIQTQNLGLALLDAHGHVLLSNAKLKDWTGALLSCVSWDPLLDLRCVPGTLLGGSLPLDAFGRVILRRSDGSGLPVSFCAMPIGRWRVVVMRPAFELFTAEQNLLFAQKDTVRAKARAELAVRHLGLGLWELDLQSGQIHWDDVMHQIYGLQPGEFRPSLGEWRRFVHPDDRARVDSAFRRLLLGNRNVPLTFRILRQGCGALAHIEAVAVLERDDLGRPSRALGSNVNVTTRRKQEQALERASIKADDANRAKSQFLAHMSHEMKTPLAIIKGYAEQLGEQSGHDRSHAIEAIVSAVTGLDELVSDILDLAQVDFGRVVLRPQWLEARPFFTAIASFFAQKAQLKGLQFHCHVDAEVPPFLRIDPSRVRQILHNLLGNAVKFTPSGAVSLSVGVHALDAQSNRVDLSIRVEDTGIGIAKDRQEQLFQPFFQLDDSDARLYGGTGLGLCLSRRMAALLPGEVVLESSETERGSSFRFQLHAPYRKTMTEEVVGVGDILSEGLPRSPGPSTSAVAPSLSKQHVLVVDDAPELRMLLSKVLEGAGATVQTAHDGLDALEKALCRRFDAIIMDLQMPRMDGATALARLRELGVGCPVVAVTAHGLTGIADNYTSLGFDAYFAKPIRYAELLSTLSLFAVRQSMGR